MQILLNFVGGKNRDERRIFKGKRNGVSFVSRLFFSKPSIAGKSYKRSTSKIEYSRILLELKKKEPSDQALVEIIEKDVNLMGSSI